jgi:hypothetical protein
LKFERTILSWQLNGEGFEDVQLSEVEELFLCLLTAVLVEVADYCPGKTNI